MRKLILVLAALAALFVAPAQAATSTIGNNTGGSGGTNSYVFNSTQFLNVGVTNVNIRNGVVLTNINLQGVLYSVGTNGAKVVWSNGVPEGTITAPIGSLYLQTNSASPDTVLYVKGSGAGNTGWFPVTQSVVSNTVVFQLGTATNLTLVGGNTGTGTTFTNNGTVLFSLLTTNTYLGLNTGGAVISIPIPSIPASTSFILNSASTATQPGTNSFANNTNAVMNATTITNAGIWRTLPVLLSYVGTTNVLVDLSLGNSFKLIASQASTCLSFTNLPLNGGVSSNVGNGYTFILDIQNSTTMTALITTGATNAWVSGGAATTNLTTLCNVTNGALTRITGCNSCRTNGQVDIVVVAY